MSYRIKNPLPWNRGNSNILIPAGAPVLENEYHKGVFFLDPSFFAGLPEEQSARALCLGYTRTT